MIPSHADLSFTVLLFNADSAGNPLEHFSAEETGQKTFYEHVCVKYGKLSCKLSKMKLCVAHVEHSPSPRSPEFLLPPAAGLLHRLLHLRPASVPGSEEKRSHAHRPQSADRRAGAAGMLRSVQLHPLGQVEFQRSC